jgi:hypothetical protein
MNRAPVRETEASNGKGEMRGFFAVLRMTRKEGAALRMTGERKGKRVDSLP